jgi:glutamate-1-semialdehyde 2,1-aminomutase
VNETIVVSLDNENAVKQAFSDFKDQIACVIIEPVPANNGLLLQRKEYLQFLREICTQNNTLLIFDEVINGFRIGFDGAAGYYKIQPDIITYGKIIGGGLPVGMYGASTKIMSCISPEGDVYQAGTLSGNPVAMAAGIAQLTECLKPGFYEGLESKTKFLINAIMKDLNSNVSNFQIFSIGSIFWIAFTGKKEIRSAEEIDGDSMKHFRVLHKELLEKGIYLGPSGYEVGFVCEAHTEADLLKTAEAFKEALSVVFN